MNKVEKFVVDGKSTGTLADDSSTNAIKEIKDRSAILSFASSNVRYSANTTPIGKVQLTTSLQAWKGERISAQILIWPSTNIRHLSVKATDFKGPGQSSFPANALSYGFIRYILANESGGNCGKIPNLPTLSVPDAISPQQSITVNKNQLQPVWLSVSVPSTVPAGTYTGKLTCTDDSKGIYDTLTVAIQVANHILPPPLKWDFFLDLGQFPLSEAKYYKVKPWSEEHFTRIRTNMRRLADAGEKVITTSFFWDMFSMEGVGSDEGTLMIRVQKKANNEFTYDFTNFDKWVTFMMGLGINKQISVYGLYPFNSNFEFYFKNDKTDYSKQQVAPAKSGMTIRQNYTKQAFTLLSDDYKTFWKGMLSAFAKHLKDKGWFDRTVLFIDERPAKETKAVIDFVKSTVPDFKVGYAGGYHSEFMENVDYFSIASYLTMPLDMLDRRKKQGKITTDYTCCTEKHPNIFTYSDPAEGVFLGWYAVANNYDGYTRYAYNQWVTYSGTDTRHPSLPAGDYLLVYPNDNSSVRFEKLREGIQDFEKIEILQREWKKNNQNDKLNKLATILSRFKRTSVNSINDYKQVVEDAQRFINSQ
ncbi:DUF4091 domain-containing protein [Chitinophaga sp.]|uniref:DUF4091 domain-containing protein n=1 Tax=Chitinophaga sp. TaxID=1869181 RepID=UPI002F923225